MAERGGLEFEAWFNERREAHRSWDVDESAWRFPARYIPERRLLGWNAKVPIPELRAVRPDLFVLEYDRAHLAAGFVAATRYARRTAFRVLPNFDAWSDRTWWRETGKHIVFRAVDGAKVPGPDGQRLAERYGLEPSRIHRVTQTIDVARFARARQMTAGERDRRRAELGLSGCVFAFAGRLWSGKGVDELIAAYREVAAEATDVSLLLIGDGPDEQRYRADTRQLNRVRFAGFVQGPELPEMYALADVFVFPTHGDPNGLVIEEAQASGLPVISAAAAGDIRDRIPGAEEGFVVDAGRPDQLAFAMRRLAQSPALREQLAAEGTRRAELHEHRRYAADFEHFVNAVMRAPRRTGPVAAVVRAVGASLALTGRGEASARVTPRG